MRKPAIVLAVVFLSGCSSFMETFAPEVAAKQRQEKIYAGYFAQNTDRNEIKALLLSDDIANVRAGIQLFFLTPEGQAMYMRAVVATYGPMCVGVGIKPDTPEFGQCVISRAEAEASRQQQSRDARMLRDAISGPTFGSFMATTNCTKTLTGFTCTQF